MFVKNNRTGPKWIEGTVCKRLGQVSYIVKIKNRVELRRHSYVREHIQGLKHVNQISHLTIFLELDPRKLL